MRIVAGKNKGNILKSPKDLSIRPTSQKVREALFDILRTDIEETFFLDLFAGTGAVGIEALSRGAKKVIFIDKEVKCIKIIKENLERTKNSQNAFVYKIDFLAGLKLLAKKNYLLDYIFLDPPYSKGLINITSLAPLLKASIPTAPVPANRSKKQVSLTGVPKISNNASLTFSEVGRTDKSLGDFNILPLFFPATILIISP